MVGEMAKARGRRRWLYISCNYSCTLCILVKILLAQLKNVHTSACLKLNNGTAKQNQKNVKVAKMVEFIKTCDQYAHRFNFGNFFNSIILLPRFCWGKIDLQKTLFGRNGQFPSAWRVMIKTWGRVFLAAMIKNEQIQVFDSEMYLSVILTL